MRLEKMTWPQAKQYFEKNNIVLIPLGSTECHGRHMPLGTDTLIPEKILTLIEEKTDVMIAPVMPYGCTDYLAPFPGTVNLGHDVLYQVMTKICESLYVHGARKFVILNGHGGNIPVLDRVALDLQKKGGMLVQLNWWQMVWNIVPDYEGNMPWHGGHGGAEETSAILYIDEALVDFKEIQDAPMKDIGPLKATGMKNVVFKGVEIPVPRFSNDISDNGWFGNDHPRFSSRKWGEALVKGVSEYILDFLEELKKI